MSLADVAHELLGADILVRARLDTDGIDTALSSKLTAAERAAELSSRRISGSGRVSINAIDKIREAQLRQNAAQETYNRLLREGETDVVRLSRAQAGAISADRRVRTAQAEAALAGKSTTSGSALAQRALSQLPGGTSAAALASRVPLGAAIGGGAAIVAGVAAVDLAKQSIDVFNEQASAIRAFQRASSTSAETASRLHYVFDRFNIDSQTAATGVLRLGRNLDATPGKLQKFGVAIARDHDGRVDLAQTLLNANDAFHALPDGAQRADLALSLFGRGGQALLPILAANRDTLKEFMDEAQRKGLVFSQKDLENSFKYQQNVKDLHEEWTRLQVDVGRRVLPGVTDALAGVDAAVNKSADAAHRLHVDTVAKYTVGLPFQALGALGRKVSGHHADQAGDAAAEAKASQDRIEQAQAVADSLASSFAGYRSSVSPFDAVDKAIRASKGQSVDDAKRKLVDAEHAVTLAEERLTALRSSRTVPSALRLATAEESLRKAKERQATASEKVTDAEKRTAGAHAATALSIGELQKRLTGHRKQQQAEAREIGRLSREGLSRESIVDLVNLDKTAPGTLAEAAHKLTARTIKAMNRENRKLDAAASIVSGFLSDDTAVEAAAKHNAEVYALASTKWGKRISAEIRAIAAAPSSNSRFAHDEAAASARPAGPTGPLSKGTAAGSAVYQFYGPITFTDPKQAARVAQARRRQALSRAQP